VAERIEATGIDHLIPFEIDEIDAVLFDMDGTLVDTDDVDVQKWARRVERITGRSPETSEKVARSAVMAMESPVNAFFTLMDKIGLDRPIIDLALLINGGDAEHEPLPPIVGIHDMIGKIGPHFPMGIVSTRTTDETRLFLSYLDILDNFNFIVGRDSTYRIKPHPEPILHAARELGVDPSRCLMVGDTTVDIRSARRAGAVACGVLCGFGRRHELERAGAHVILDHTALVDRLMMS